MSLGRAANSIFSLSMSPFDNTATTVPMRSLSSTICAERTTASDTLGPVTTAV